MAVIEFIGGRTTVVPPQKAIKLMLIRRGQLPGTPAIMKYLKRVKHIHFETSTPPPVIPQGRLPYKD